MIDKLEKYWRAVNYLTLAHIYLKDNALCEREMTHSDLKTYPSGHWGTSPSVNFIIAHVNRYITEHDKKIQLIIGTGHSGSALGANLFLEGSMREKYKMSDNLKEAINQFLNMEKNIPGIRSEIGPFFPGSIYDGGELGYSLAVAMGAVLNDEELTAVVIIGDGECETGCLAGAWNSIKCLGTKRGHILPIINLNGYRMGDESLLAKKTDEELVNMFDGMGYEVKIVYGIHEQMIDSMEWANDYFEEKKDLYGDRNPLIILKTPKGWTAPDDEKIKIEGTVKSHKNPLYDLNQNEHTFQYLKKWLLQYNPQELFDGEGNLCHTIQSILPRKEKRLGMQTYDNHCMNYPQVEKFEVQLCPEKISSMNCVSHYLEEIIRCNRNCFKIFSPDELSSNRLGALLQYKDNVIEILNEMICQAWMQGYTITGKTALMISYEAFMPIVTSMVSQFTKFLYQSEQTGWREERPSLNYLLTSTCWENTYSHQNPEFVNSLIIQQNPYANVYYPIDSNTLLVCLDRSLQSKQAINVITVSKGNMSQYTNIDTARGAIENGYILWNKPVREPDIYFVAIGDYCLSETKSAVEKFEEMYPHISYSFISILELMRFLRSKIQIQDDENNVFQFKEKKVVVVFHGYPLVINAVLNQYLKECDYIVLGYQNKSIASAGVHEKMEMNNCSADCIVARAAELLELN